MLGRPTPRLPSWWCGAAPKGLVGAPAPVLAGCLLGVVIFLFAGVGPVGEPARGYSRPPFPPNNVEAMRHGVHSERRFLPLASTIAEELLAELDDVTVADRLAVEEIAVTRAKKRLIDIYLDENGQLHPDDDEVRSAALYAIRLARLLREQEAALWRRRQERERSTAAGVDVLAVLRAEGRALMAARGDDGVEERS